MKRDIDQLIIKEFGKRYVTRSIADISVKEIVLSCHINRTTFYKHFADIYDVRDEIENRFIDNFKRVISQNIATGEQMSNISRYFPQIISNNDFYFGILLKSPDRYHTVARLSKELTPFYRTQMHINRNEMTDYVLAFFTSGLCAILVQWTLGNQQTSSAKLGELFEELINDGVYPTLKHHN